MNTKMLHYTDGGLKNVWLQNGFEIRKTPYGEGVAIHDVDGLTQAICSALISKSGPLTGLEFRYIRNGGMLLSQANLGAMMGVDAQTVARWEKHGRLPKWADKMVRLLFMAHVDFYLYNWNVFSNSAFTLFFRPAGPKTSTPEPCFKISMMSSGSWL